MFKFKNTISFNAKALCNSFMRKLIICAVLIGLVSSLSAPVFAAEKNGLSYSGESYYAVVKYGVNARDKNDNVVSYISAGVTVKVLGAYNKDSSRVVIMDGNTAVTVLGVGLKRTTAPTSGNQSSSGLKYTGESYYATVKLGLNLRDKNNNVICYLSAGTEVYVKGLWTGDSSRAVVEYGNKSGTVLNSGLKKSATSTGGNQSSSGLKYSGESYYATVKYGLNMRDKNNNVIRYIGSGVKVHVLGVYTNDSSRVVIEYNGVTGTVLKSGLTAVSSGGSGGNVSQSSYSYCAVVTKGVNLKKSNGELVYLPPNSLVCVKGANAKDKTRVDVSFYEIEGSVLKNNIEKVNDALFLSIYRQKTTVVKNSKIVAQSDCVTGLENVRSTRRGEFKVKFMQRNRTLTGWDYNGKYYESTVSYWVRFYGKTGFHDNSKRTSFGGNIYKTNGSNGCVNLPYNFAKTLYANAYVGMPVYVA